jgi:hypothetical protein
MFQIFLKTHLETGMVTGDGPYKYVDIIFGPELIEVIKKAVKIKGSYLNDP